MGYIIRLSEEELLRIRKKQQFVVFLHEKQDVIHNGETILFAIPYKEIHRVAGQAKITHSIFMDKEKLRQVIEDAKQGNVAYDSKQEVDLRNIGLFEEHEEEALLFNSLQKGYDNWKKVYKEDLFTYLQSIGYADSKENIMTQSVDWYHAVCFEDIDIYEEKLPLYFFADMQKARADYNLIREDCNRQVKIPCYRCEFIGGCLNNGVRLRNHALGKLEKEWTEASFIHETLSGLRNVNRQ